MRELVCVLGVFAAFCSAVPSIELTISEKTGDEPTSCPYLISLPATDALCVAADQLAQGRGFKFVKFHLVRDFESQRLAILGCADSSCSALPSLPSSLSDSQALALSHSSDEWSCCAPNSSGWFEAPSGLLSSMRLPAACYRVQCVESTLQLPAVEHPGSFLPWKEGQQLGEQIPADLGFVEFILLKYERFSPGERAIFIAVCSVFLYLSLRGYFVIRKNNRTRSFFRLFSADDLDPAKTLQSSRSPDEVTQPYEVALNPGEGDSVEFGPWQLPLDLEIFNRKLVELKHRVSKLPFAHAADAERAGSNGEGVSVVFLGRNVDEPKLVFRNPRVERMQRANIPVYTQSIRNAVISSVLRDTPGFKAYVPRAVVGAWNQVEGVFQEFVPTAKSVSLQDFKDSPAMALDLALVILLLRDTDAHEGNYARDPRRKIALFDLGCALGDRPLPSYDRECLDNFEVLQRLPDLLDVPFEDRHIQYIKAIDFVKAKEMWTNFKYDSYLVTRTEKKRESVKRRNRANSSIFPISAATSPRSLPALIGGLLSPRSRPVVQAQVEVASASTTATHLPGLGERIGTTPGSSQLGSPKSTRSLPTSDFFPTGWETSESDQEEEEDVRLSNVLDMLRVMEMHAKFLLRCAEEKKTFLFAAKVMYSGFYDERWLELGGRIEDLPALERELLNVASSQEPPELRLDLCISDSEETEAVPDKRSPVDSDLVLVVQ